VGHYLKLKAFERQELSTNPRGKGKVGGKKKRKEKVKVSVHIRSVKRCKNQRRCGEVGEKRGKPRRPHFRKISRFQKQKQTALVVWKLNQKEEAF